MTTPNSTSSVPWWIGPNGEVDPRYDPENSYNFIPTAGVCAAFVALYSISTLLHIGQATWYRTWFMIPTAGLAGILEILGWSGRLWSSQNVDLNTPFMIQIIGTILGPTPLLAADFVIFGTIVERLGAGYSRMAPKWYTIIFVICDVISLVVQAVGGAEASQASNRHDREGARRGGHIMLGGIVFQLFVIIMFTIFATEFVTRYLRERPITIKGDATRGPLPKRIKLMIAAVAFNVTCLFIRAVYRTIELSDGWNGRIISTQVYFNVLDGAMVTLAMFTVNFIHPGLMLRPEVDLEPGEKSLDSRSSS